MPKDLVASAQALLALGKHAVPLVQGRHVLGEKRRPAAYAVDLEQRVRDGGGPDSRDPLSHLRPRDPQRKVEHGGGHRTRHVCREGDRAVPRKDLEVEGQTRERLVVPRVRWQEVKVQCKLKERHDHQTVVEREVRPDGELVAQDVHEAVGAKRKRRHKEKRDGPVQPPARRNEEKGEKSQVLRNVDRDRQTVSPVVGVGILPVWP